MEIGEIEMINNQNMKFKIDLIVWKLVFIHLKRPVYNKFKIDLIVWKFIE